MKIISVRFMLQAMVMCFTLSLMMGCKKYADPEQIFESQPTKPYVKQRKVMLISIDGAAGLEIKKIMPTTIAGMLEHSKFSWEAFADARTKDGPSWINLLTGRSASSLAVADSTLHAVTEGEEGEHEEVPRYSTLLQRLLEGGIEYTSVAVSPWENLVHEGFGFANQAIHVSNDEAVKDTIIAKMALAKLGTVVVNFNSVNLAGLKSGFLADKQEYHDAVVKVDGYIGEIMTALKSRPTYDREDWLVIITSNHGGTGNSYGGASFPERKILTIYYQPDFSSKEFVAPNLLPMTQLSGHIDDPINAKISPENSTLYNFGSSGEYTVQLKVKFASRGSTWPAFFGKKGTSENTASRPGWLFMLYDPAGEPQWRPFIGGETGGPVSSLSDKGLVLNQWNTLTMKIYEEDGKRLVAGYTNGKRHSSTFEITGKNLDNDLPLTLGVMPGWVSTGPTFDVSDIRIYNTALPDELIASEYCQSEISNTDPYNDYLIGYWPAAEGSGNKLVNHSVIGQGKDFIFTKTNPWNLLIPNFCNTPDEEDSNALFMQNTDIASQIFYWMQIKTSSTWELEGTVWLSKYEQEFIK